MESFFAVLQTIVVLAIVIALAHISLRLLNKYMLRQNTIIKIWEKTSINTNSSIGIVEVSGKYYLMSFTQNENKILEELDAAEIEEILKQKQENMDIKENTVYKRINSLIEKRR